MLTTPSIVNATPASQAALPNVVRDDDLARANVLMGSTWGTMLAVGAALGGLVTAVLGRDAAIVIDSGRRSPAPRYGLE